MLDDVKIKTLQANYTHEQKRQIQYWHNLSKEGQKQVFLLFMNGNNEDKAFLKKEVDFFHNMISF